MKIAIEFYGHIRTFRETADNIITNLIMPLGGFENVDIFIHCWDKTDHCDLTWHNMTCEQRGLGVSIDDINFLKEKYHTDKIICEPQLTIENDRDYLMKGSKRNISFRVLKNTYYTRYSVSKLRQNYEKQAEVEYDWVIQARLDLIFNKPVDFIKNFNLEYYIPDLENIIFYSWCGSEFSYYNYPTCGPGGTDILYFGKPEAMNKLSNLYDNLDNIDLDKYLYSCDYLLLYNAIRQNMTTIPFNYFVHKDFTILRTEEIQKYYEKYLKSQTIKSKNYFKTFIHTFKIILYGVLFVLSFIPLFNIILNKQKYYKKISKYYNFLDEK